MSDDAEFTTPTTSQAVQTDWADDSLPMSSNKSWWLEVLSWTLLGYALFGRGWAYLPGPPLFIGEIVLVAGLVTALLASRWSGLFTNVPIISLVALAAWGLSRTMPYLSQYGADALRDAMIWAYGAYAVLILCYLQTDPTRLTKLLRRYRQFCWIFLCAIPFVWVATHSFSEALPRWPWANVTVIDAKGGDVLVHLAGILAFFASGLAGRVGFLRLALLTGMIGVVGSFNRGGLVAVVATIALCMCLRPRNLTLWRTAAIATCAMVLLMVSGLKFSLEGKERKLSFDQLVENMASVAIDTGNNEMRGTKNWRLDWWSDIYQYTVQGKYFWTGKGFGINLADDDGFQGTLWEDRLRSPHNGHLTFLARSGVPGFALWMLTQMSWAWYVGYAYLRSVRQRDVRWSNLLFFLLAYWLAFIVNATFDVFLEGPMGGIWFWTVFGVGLSAAWIYEHYPEVFAPVSAQESTS